MKIPFLLRKLLVRSGTARHFRAARARMEEGGAWIKYYSDRVVTAPHAALADAAQMLTLQPDDVIDLAAGYPSFDLVPSGSTKLPLARRGLPPLGGLPELRAAVAELLQNDHGLSVDPSDEVLITHGVTGGLATALDAFLNPGDVVVLFDPSSPLYSLTLATRQARVRWVRTWIDQGRLRFHQTDLARALRGARMLIVNSPSNPSGAALAAEDLEQIAALAELRDVLIFSDESYDRYWYGERVAPIATIGNAAERTITTGSISKNHALGSARVGWLSGNRYLLRACVVAAAPMPFVSTLNQQIALAGLKQPAGAFAPVLAEFDSRRRYACERLRAIGFPVALPAGGFFFWLPVGALNLTGREFAERFLQQERVWVLPGDLFGPSGRAYVRLSYVGEDGRLQEGLLRLAHFIQGALPVRTRQAA